MDYEEPTFFDVWFNITTPEHVCKPHRFITSNNIWFLSWESFAQIILIAGMFTLLRSLFTEFVYYPFCKSWKFFEDDYPRFYESAWQLTYYLLIWIYSAYIIIPSTYFKETWRVYEDPFPFQTIEETSYWLCIISLGWYLHCVYAHVCLDPRKKDYWEMLLHHVAALALLYLALTKGYYRFVSLTLFCLDISDIFLHTCKVLRVVDNVAPLNPIFKNVMFATLPISWLVFRLFIFVQKAMFAASWQSIYYGGWQNCDYHLVFNGLLLIIFWLQVMWFYFIMKIVVKHVLGGEEYDDVRDPHFKRKEE